MKTVWLLVVSNLFMTFAWYGHLKQHRESPLWIVVLASWGIGRRSQEAVRGTASRLFQSPGGTTALCRWRQPPVRLNSHEELLADSWLLW